MALDLHGSLTELSSMIGQRITVSVARAGVEGPLAQFGGELRFVGEVRDEDWFMAAFEDGTGRASFILDEEKFETAYVEDSGALVIVQSGVMLTLSLAPPRAAAM